MDSASDLFDLSVNASGKEWIRRFAKLIKWVILFGILISLVELLAIFVRLFYLHPLLKNNSMLEFSNLTDSFWLIGYLIILFIQLILLARMSKTFSLAIDANDGQTLAKGLRLLYYYAFFGLVSLIASVIIGSFDLVVSFKYYKVF